MYFKLCCCILIAFIHLDSVMFIVQDKLCFWDVTFSGEFEIWGKKKISQNIYMVHQCKICGLGALVFWGFLYVNKFCVKGWGGNTMNSISFHHPIETPGRIRVKKWAYVKKVLGVLAGKNLLTELEVNLNQTQCFQSCSELVFQLHLVFLGSIM